MTPTPRTPKTTTTTTAEESPSAAASRYQQLRSHLAELKLTAAAEALPAVLDQAAAEGLSLTVALERLLAVEVDASTARRLAGRLRFACLPTPATLDDFDVELAMCQLVGPLAFARMTGLHTMSRHHCEHIVDDFLTAHQRMRPGGQPASARDFSPK